MSKRKGRPKKATQIKKEKPVDEEEDEDSDNSWEQLLAKCDEEAAARAEVRKQQQLTPAEREAKRKRHAEREAKRKAKRERALKRQRKETLQTKHRDQCDCYMDKSIVRAAQCLRVVEKRIVQLTNAKPGTLEAQQLMKMLSEQKAHLMALRRMEDESHSRASRYLQAFAVVTQPLIDINVVRHEGEPLQTTHYTRWSFLENKARPKRRT